MVIYLRDLFHENGKSTSFDMVCDEITNYELYNRHIISHTMEKSSVPKSKTLMIFIITNIEYILFTVDI